LGIGVIPLHRFGVAEISTQLQRSSLPLERLTLGIGAGIGRGLTDVRAAVAQLREQQPGIKVAIAAVGPKMCQLGGEIADAVLLSWALPSRIRWARERVEQGAEQAGRPAPRIAGYVRVALGATGEERIRHEVGRYQKAPHYARSFSEQEDDLIGIALERPDASELAQRLQPYRAVLDTCVVRGLPASDDVDAWLEIAELAAPKPPRDRASSR
jgi:alkanesulfonate monooxygenase SsuD/methylene tetrahydromethanopterin reductase-like flavin-dependent oxidoreductase (luciferase family)